MIDTVKPLRSDAQRTAAAILQAAERVLRHDPTASLGQIAAAAGGISRASTSSEPPPG